MERSKREKKGNAGRLAALEKLREAKSKGKVHKTEFTEELEDKVYDVVAEEEYAEIVRGRQDDDWIVDDDGSGYVEDGREVFDEDAEYDMERGSKKGNKSRFIPKNKNIQDPALAKKTDITKFLKSSSSKKSAAAIDTDDIMAELESELLGGPSARLKPLETAAKPSRASIGKEKRNPFAKSGAEKRRQASPPSSPLKPRPTKLMRPSLGSHSKVEETPVQARVDFQIEDDDSPLFDNPGAFEEDVDDLETRQPSETAINHDEKREEEESEPLGPTEKSSGDGKSTARGFAVDLKEETHLVDRETFDSFAKKAIKREEPEAGTPSSGGFTGGFSRIAPGTMIEAEDSAESEGEDRGDDEDLFSFYWLDAYEDVFKHPGLVYLFGKCQSGDKWKSVCVAVKQVERTVFFLPREKRLVGGKEAGEELEFTDVYEEVKDVFFREKINDFRIKKSQKSYAFHEVDVPSEATFLEVRYPASYKQISSDLSGETFSRVFGTTSSGLECLLLEKKLRGPSWLTIKRKDLNKAVPGVSWCREEYFIEGTKPLIVETENKDPPPLNLFVINFLTCPAGNRTNEIIGASFLTKANYSLNKPLQAKDLFDLAETVVSHPHRSVLPYDFMEKKARFVRKESNERSLLNYLLAMIMKHDPDIIVGHDIVGYGLEFLLHRLQHNSVPIWSRISRLKRSSMPKFSTSKAGLAEAVAGRLYADSKLIAKELVRARSYDMGELVRQVLGENRQDIAITEIENMFKSSGELNELLGWSQTDALFCLRIVHELNALPLFVQITQIVGGVMSKTLMGGRSERNEFLLLHAFHDKNFICPDKMSWKKRQAKGGGGEPGEEERDEVAAGSKKKNSYAGGLVLDPKKGLYDSFILLLDFNSLYPSIIQEYNICFTTVDLDTAKNPEGIPDVPQGGQEQGILPTEIKKLVESRRQVKGLMKTPKLPADKMAQYNVRQLALKLTANSMYGCLGFGHSRFYAKPLAALITAKGREILLHTKELVEKSGLEVIYGDTDSIMINTNSTDYDKVFELGRKVKNDVNKLYKLLELDIDGVYKRLLLLKKKKYAGLAVEKLYDGTVKLKKEMKGLDIVRRDWSQVAKDAGNFVVEEILKDQTCDVTVEKIHQYLYFIAKEIKDGKLKLEKYEISKALTKSPQEYADKGQPHVNVALRMNKEGKAHFGSGDTVAYIICKDGTNNPATQRAYNAKEVETSETLIIDWDYYLAQQVHPVISRLCDPIEGTDSARIAECLGMDPASYKKSQNEGEEGEEVECDLSIPPIDYSKCVPFNFPCQTPDCTGKVELTSPFVGETDQFRLAKCSNDSCKQLPLGPNFSSLPFAQNRLLLEARKSIVDYYSNWMVCDDSACRNRTRRIPFRFTKEGKPVCPKCGTGSLNQEVTEKMLFAQLSYFKQSLELDDKKAVESGKKMRMDGEQVKAITKAHKSFTEIIDQKLELNKYSEVDLSHILRFFNTTVSFSQNKKPGKENMQQSRT